MSPRRSKHRLKVTIICARIIFSSRLIIFFTWFRISLTIKIIVYPKPFLYFTWFCSYKSTLSMLLVSLKLAFVTVTICLNKTTITMHFVIFELTFINCTINNYIPSDSFNIFLILSQLTTEVRKFNTLTEFQTKINLIWIQRSSQKSCEI